jgi:hypothetical protein
MARPPKQSSSPALSAGQSAYVLERLIAERRVSTGDVNRIISEMGREISDLEQKLQRLREAHGGAPAAAPTPARRGPGRPPGSGTGRRRGRPPASATAAAAAAPATPAKGGAKRRKRRGPITAEQLASRQLQGRYLALVRQFAATRRPQYAKIAKERGREAAIREMQSSLKK